MHTGIASNWRPLLRALSVFFIGIAALWAMPRNARAQLYVSSGSHIGVVGEYDAKTGAVINANFITGLHSSGPLALHGHTLFVTDFSAGTVGTYNAKTGAAINANFITLGLTSAPVDLALLGNTLFVADNNGFVGTYNAKTGAAINANFITGLPAVAGGPEGLALLGNTLFVSNDSNNTVSTYDATTGAVINANFITGLPTRPVDLALLGNTLFVTQLHVGVGTCDVETGAVINADFVTGISLPNGLAVRRNERQREALQTESPRR